MEADASSGSSIRGPLGSAVARNVDAAGPNAAELLSTLDRVPADQADALRFLLAHLPARDARTLSAEHLAENVEYAQRVRHETPCGMEIPEEVFLEYVLPHAHLDERRDRWRPELFDRYAELARRSASIEDAVSTLNRVVFHDLGVTYHASKRPHDNMSPLQSIEWGYASCTGLSILLACACRAVGIPARLVGTPLWTDGSGNHTWVEVWDFGTWRFLGASEPGAFDSTWFNERARSADPQRREHRIYAARYSSEGEWFPLAWNPDERAVPADDVTERYASCPPAPRHPTRVVTEPRAHVCHRVEGPIRVTGRMDDPAWERVPWTERFLDIEGHGKPTPRFETRARLCWDDEYLYVGAYLEDPHVWGTLTERNSIIFNDPDFEVFLDPDGDHHGYYEFEVNALGTIWELTLERPYRDGGPVHRGDNMPGVVCAVHVDGTLNDSRDQDRGWSVEIAFPWEGLRRYAGSRACPPVDGEEWRVNFSRVHWLADVIDGAYRKVPREAHPEDNWVWSPQMAIDMHRPERWGRLQFSTERADGTARVPQPDPLWPARELLVDLYHQQVERGSPSHDVDDFVFKGVRDPTLGPLSIRRASSDSADDGWVASVDVRLADETTTTCTIDARGRFTQSR